MHFSCIIDGEPSVDIPPSTTKDQRVLMYSLHDNEIYYSDNYHFSCLFALQSGRIYCNVEVVNRFVTFTFCFKRLISIVCSPLFSFYRNIGVSTIPGEFKRIISVLFLLFLGVFEF